VTFSVPHPDLDRLKAELKPLLRGWLHLGMVPLAFASGVVLVVLAEGNGARAATAVYAASGVLMFGASALLHRGHWSRRVDRVLTRIDHSTIFVFIAGSYTPLAVLTLHGAARVAVLVSVWAGAALGVVFRTTWLGAPRWLFTSLYVLLGWTAAYIVPQLLHGAGVAAFVLVCIGGALYTTGGIVYGLRRPNPAPRVFGFHELFHTLTVAAFITQYVAISLITYRA
jgi:hemolysin III